MTEKGSWTPIDWLTDSIKPAGRLVKQMKAYLALMAGLIANGAFLWGKDQDFGGWYWAVVAGTCAPLIVAMLWKGQHDIRRWRRETEWKQWALVAKEVPAGYFRLFPYEAADGGQFQRADQAHVKVLQWIREAKSQFLVLTGESGVGKSSLLNAYVIPQLEGADPPWLVMLLRSFDNPVSELRRRLLEKGPVWDQPPTKDAANWSDIELVSRAAKRLADSGKRLLLVFDQFEELVILHEQTPKQVVAFRAWLEELKATPCDNVTVLFSLRSDYRSLLERFGLPLLEQNRNWREVLPFTLTEAREFLDRSRLELGEERRERVLAEAMMVDDSRGLVRPITLNMVGEILRVQAGQPGKLRRHENLLTGFIRECVQAPRIREHAEMVLDPLVTKTGTKRPLTVDEIHTELVRRGHSLPVDAIDGCLLELSESGLVRRLNHAQDTPIGRRLWEVSHDFISRLLAGALRDPVPLSRRLRPIIIPVALLLWGIFAIATVTVYIRSGPERAAFRIRRDYDLHVQPTDLGYNLDVKIADPRRINELFQLIRQLERINRMSLHDVYVDRVVLLKGLPVQRFTLLYDSDLRYDMKLAPVPALNLSPLAGLKGLTELNLSNTPVNDLSSLVALNDLTELELFGCKSVSDLSPLRELKGLARINLSGTSVSDLSPLVGLSGLTRLDLDICEKLNDLSSLAGLNELTMLNLGGTAITDLSPLVELSRLTTLSLAYTESPDLSPLARLKRLTTLNLRSTPVSDLSPLAELNELTTLNLNSTDISKLLPLAGLHKLRILDLESTAVSDLSPLAELSELIELNLVNTKVNDLAPLTRLSKLTKLDLRGTKVRDLSPIAKLDGIQEIWISTVWPDEKPVRVPKSLEKAIQRY